MRCANFNAGGVVSNGAVTTVFDNIPPHASQTRGTALVAKWAASQWILTLAYWLTASRHSYGVKVQFFSCCCFVYSRVGVAPLLVFAVLIIQL